MVMLNELYVRSIEYQSYRSCWPSLNTLHMTEYISASFEHKDTSDIPKIRFLKLVCSKWPPLLQ